MILGSLSIISTNINSGFVNSKCWKLFSAILSSYIYFSLNLKHRGTWKA